MRRRKIALLTALLLLCSGYPVRTEAAQDMGTDIASGEFSAAEEDIEEGIEDNRIEDSLEEDSTEAEAGTGEVLQAGEEPEALPGTEGVLGQAEEAEDTGSPSGEEPLAGYIPLEEESDTPGLLDDSGISPVAVALPDSYIVSGVGPVRRQRYGNCWAFSSMYMAEASMSALWNIKDEDYSELHLSYFTYNSPEDPLGGTRGDTNRSSKNDFLRQGGNLSLAEKVLAGWVGAADEKTAPCTEEEKAAVSGLDAAIAYDDRAHLQNAYHVNLEEDRQAAKGLIYRYGGIGISYYSDGKEKYYNKTHNSYYCPEDTKEDHGVAVIGWDDHFPAEYFDTGSHDIPQGDGAWYVRNSWGEDRECYEGYFWLSYYDKSISQTAYSFVFEDAGNYGHNYQYDGAIASRTGSYGTKSLSIANVFQVRSGAAAESVKAVSFFTYNANTEYTVRIYKNPALPSDPESGTPVEAAAVTGKTSFQGYYTVPLKEELPLARGETFAVVVTLSKADENVSFVAEAPAESWYVCTAQAQEGQSFCKSPGGSWTDYGKEYGVNIRIKAFTDDTTIPLERLLICGAEEEMPCGARRQLTAAFEPENTTDERSILWSSSDQDVASVSENGELLAVSPGSACITARAGAVLAQVYVTVYATDEEAAEPILTAKTVAVNKYALAGSRLPLLETEGNHIQEIHVDSALFQIKKSEDGSWMLSLEPGQINAFPKKKTLEQTLLLRTDKGDYEKPLKITVVVNKPSISLKNAEKLNVFYTDSRARYRLSGAQEVESVRWESGAEEGTPVKAELEAFADGTAVFAAPGLCGENYARFLKGAGSCRRGILTVHFAGYSEEADQRISLNVAVENRKPVWASNPPVTEIYPQYGVKRGSFYIYDTEAKKNISLEGCKASCLSQADIALTADEGSGRINYIYGGTLSVKNAKIELQNDGWTQKATVSHRIVAAKALAVSLSKKTVTLNTAVSGADSPPLRIQAAVKGSGMKLTKLEADPQNAWIREGIIKCGFDVDGQALTVQLAKAPSKNGSKRLKLLGTAVNEEGTELAGISVSLTVKVTSSRIRVSLKKQGGINLLEREKTMCFKPKAVNLTDSIEEVELAESFGNEESFSAWLNEAGLVELQARKGASLAAGRTLRLILRFRLGSGCEVEETVSVRPVQKNPRLVTPVAKAVLYRRTGQKAVYPVGVEAGSQAKIERIEALGSTYADDFLVSEFDGEKMEVSLRRQSTLSPGSYTLRFHIYFQDSASNRGAAVKKFKITVK